jgi:hypothetical protein
MRVVSAAIAVGLVAAMSLAAAPAANASVPPASYLVGNYGCIRVSNGANSYDILDFSRPYAVANYAGTSELYWGADVQKAVNGRWVNVNANAVDGAFSTIWGHKGAQLTPIYWGNTANNDGVAAYVSGQGTYRVVGMTYWWNGKVWSVSNLSLLQCTFSG